MKAYKSLLISELAQMYIRHSVSCGKRNPITGKPVNGNNIADEKTIKNMINYTMEVVDAIVDTTYNSI